MSVIYKNMKSKCSPGVTEKGISVTFIIKVIMTWVLEKLDASDVMDLKARHIASIIK